MEASDQPDRDSEAIEELIEAGTDIAGAAAGVGLGVLVGGAGGALVGGTGGVALAHGLRRVAIDIKNRLLSGKETARVGAVLALAAEEIDRRLRNGQRPRTDGFFEQQLSSGETSAEEVAEGTLIVAQRTYEERKIPYLGKLLAAIAFDASITSSMAHALLKLMDTLTYRQLLLLSLFGRNLNHSNPFQLREQLYGPGSGPETFAIGHDAFDLYQRALIYRHNPETGQGTTVFGGTDIAPSLMATEGMGNVLARAAGLLEMPGEDVLGISRALGQPATE